jgi:C1A family cysteine protease
MRAGLIGSVCAVLLLVLVPPAFGDSSELESIREAIRRKGAGWIAGESWVTRLTPEERRGLLGVNTLEVGIRESESVLPLDAAEVPARVDWRDKDGHNWITPIKDQQTCGSCVAFGAVAALESLARIETNQPALDIDLSEMHLFNCGGGSCIYGWTNSAACSYLRQNGVPDEECWPYQPLNRDCSAYTCPDWQERATKIASYGRIYGIEACKTYTAIAPILVAFAVYQDFFYYKGGIYEHTWGALDAFHAVSIVGYDTTGPTHYWIVKNSWGPGWGVDGYFAIKMGECNIENQESYWMAGAVLPETDIDLSTSLDSTTVRPGGSLGVNVTVTNNTSTVQTFYFATHVTLPSGKTYPSDGFLFGPVSVTLNPSQTRNAHLTHDVPPDAGQGHYLYNAYIGNPPTVAGIIDEDHLEFTISASVEPTLPWESRMDEEF